jgi:hypothetical protein
MNRSYPTGTGTGLKTDVKTSPSSEKMSAPMFEKRFLYLLGTEAIQPVLEQE